MRDFWLCRYVVVNYTRIGCGIAEFGHLAEIAPVGGFVRLLKAVQGNTVLVNPGGNEFSLQILVIST